MCLLGLFWDRMHRSSKYWTDNVWTGPIFVIIITMDGGEIYVKQRDRKLEKLLEQEEQDKKRNKKKKGLNKTIDLTRPQQPKPPQESIMMRKIQEYYPNHSLSTITKVMERCHNNLELILNEMLSQQQLTLQPTRASSSESRPSEGSLEADFTDNLDFSEVEISKNEFEQLFEEISEIIQNRGDIPALEQNELIDHCKDSLDEFVRVTVGFAEELNIQDVEYQDLLDREGLLMELQFFIEPIIKEMNNASKKNKVKNSLDEFPELKPADTSGSIVNKLHKEYTNSQLESQKLFQKKGEYFNEMPKLPEKWNEIHSHFSISSNDVIGSRDIKQLASEYEFMDIIDIKIIYNYLGDLDISRKFLREYYGDTKSRKRDKLNSSSKPKSQDKPKYLPVEDNEYLDENITKLSLKQLRDYVMHQSKIRAVFMGASAKISSVSERKRLMFLGNQYNHVLYQYMKASQNKFLEKAMKQNPNEIDFHGYFVAEAVEIAEKHIENLIREAKNLNPRVTTKAKGGRQIIEVHIITGKGLNSANKKSALKPAIQNMCNLKQLSFDNTEGGVLIRVPY